MKTTNLERNGRVSLKEQLAQRLTAEIESGRIPPGDRVPSINRLAEDFNLSRETVRLSLEEMVRRGTVVPRHGKGYFVSAREKRLLRVGLLARIDGVYVRPIYEGLRQALGEAVSFFVMDAHQTDTSLLALLKDLAQHQSVDRFLVVPERGREDTFAEVLAPVRRSFRVAWLDRAPIDTKDAVFLCDYPQCVRLALDHFRACGISRTCYFSRQPADGSVFTSMRNTFLEDAADGDVVSDWQDVLRRAGALENSSAPLGILAETDGEAVFLQTRLLANGVRIPEQVSIISCDNSSVTDLVQPALSAIDPGFVELGRQAGAWAKGDDAPAVAFTARPVLIQKDSCIRPAEPTSG